MCSDMIPVKYLIKESASPGNSCIKSEAELEQKEGYYPAFSASGQDVWLPDYNYSEDGIVISAVGARCGKTFLATGMYGLCANTHVLIVDKTKCNVKFLNYILNDEEWWEKGGTAQPFVKVKESLNKKIWCPPLEIQDNVVAILDVKVSKIDESIEKTRATIEEYKVLKQSIITKVFDEIENEKKWKFRYIGNLKNGINFHENGFDSIKFLNVGDFKDYMVLSNEDDFSEIMISNEDITEDALLHSGDLVFVRSNGNKALVGRCIMVDNISFPLTYSGFSIRFRKTKEDVSSKFLLYYFRTNNYKEQLMLKSFGTNINNLSQDILNDLLIPIPSMDEQNKIVSYLNKRCQLIDDLINKKVQLITELEAYKKSLIYEYVTGKKEVM